MSDMGGPIVGILGNILETKSELSGGIIRRSSTNDMCVRAVAESGGVPMILPFVADTALIDPLLAVCDGLLFPGGGDMDPAFYGEEPHEDLGEVDRALDDMWARAARHAMERRVPMLGICRGLQVLNVIYGGTLWQDIGEMDGERRRHVQHEHRYVPTQTVHALPGTRLAALIGQGDVRVNTLHHQAVKALAPGLIVSAHAEDGIVEGIESADGLMLAVQWHPEDLIDTVPVMRALFEDLVRRASARRGA